jgi:hypothetical protein
MSSKRDIETGDHVEWKWGSGTGDGDVTKVHREDVTKTIKGKKVTRKASEAKPAVEVRTEKGGKVLKSSTEVKVS